MRRRGSKLRRMRMKEARRNHPDGNIEVPSFNVDEINGDMSKEVKQLIETSHDIPSHKKILRDRFLSLLISVDVSGWKLDQVSGNFEKGVSIYGFFVENITKQVVKARMSDHIGRWSRADVDLRKPTTAMAIENCLLARTTK